MSTAGVLRRSVILRDSSHHSAPHDTASAGGASVTVGTASSPVAKSATHDRSKFEYHSSAKGGEVGARNEAAFIGYHQVYPGNDQPRLKYMMPHVINLLTVVGVYVGLFVAATEGWGIFLWDMYCRNHYATVRIERPPATA